ncbi:hypothetical protein ABEB36_000272 [Hypothenemus hampei]|uniref:Transposase n=1 Tax=Hypothenemus hampei TaxID=57062 RepID=A0ABD1FCL8_HYPHA
MPQLNYIQRAQIIIYLRDGMPIRNVAQIMNVSKNTELNIKLRWEAEGTIEKRQPPGRPRITTPEEDNALVQYLAQNPFEIARSAIRETNFSGSRPTDFFLNTTVHVKSKEN